MLRGQAGVDLANPADKLGRKALAHGCKSLSE
jgi:hypothetical protein